MVSEQRKTLAEEIFDRLYDLILVGDLPLGSELNEVALAQRFEVSRGPIREAIQRLQGLRLVTRERQMRARIIDLSAHDLVEILQLRQAVEGLACRLAANAMSDAELTALTADLERTRKGETDVLDIHYRIARGCGNRRVESLLCEDLYHLLRIYRYRSGSEPGRRPRAFEEHWQIARALAARDGALAESLMRSHIERATETLLASIAELEEPLGVALRA